MKWVNFLFAVTYLFPLKAKVYLEENFEDDVIVNGSWIVPSASHADGIPLGRWVIENNSLITTKNEHLYKISHPLVETINTKGKELIIQYSVKYPESVGCGGGGYIKLFEKGYKPDNLSKETPYLMMMGPEICENVKRVHLIWSYKGKNYPFKGNIPTPVDGLDHLFTLRVKPNNGFELYIDKQRTVWGTFEVGWDILPPQRIPDLKAIKPDYWDDKKEIADPEDRKPESWDEELLGVWKPKLMLNPNYNRDWSLPKIPNPAYFTDDEIYVLEDIGGIGFDLGQVKGGHSFGNILLTDDFDYAMNAASKEWHRNAETANLDKERFVEMIRKRAEAIINAEKEGDNYDEPIDIKRATNAASFGNKLGSNGGFADDEGSEASDKDERGEL